MRYYIFHIGIVMYKTSFLCTFNKLYLYVNCLILKMTFNVGSKDFQTNTAKTFKELWNDRDCADVILVIGDDKHIKGHKIILSTSSAFSKYIFWRYLYQNPLIYLKDIQYKYFDLAL